MNKGNLGRISNRPAELEQEDQHRDGDRPDDQHRLDGYRTPFVAVQVSQETASWD
jgi:hypothetical protein